MVRALFYHLVPNKSDLLCHLSPNARRAEIVGGGRLKLTSTSLLRDCSDSQSVTDVGLGQNQPRLRGIIFKFFSQEADVNAKVLNGFHADISPHFLSQLSLRYDFAAVESKDSKQVVLSRSQLYSFTVKFHRMLAEIDLEPIALENWIIRRLTFGMSFSNLKSRYKFY